MAVNPYVNWWSDTAEQDLLQDLTEECIQFYGFNVEYVPRSLGKEDVLYTEDTLSTFEDNFTIEVYMEDVQGFSGAGDFLNKFGLNIRDRVDLLISRRRFVDAANTVGLTRPVEGDLIYLGDPFNRAFEIKFVEHEKPFYSIGNLLCYKISCELFQYSHQDFSTGNTDIDSVETLKAYTIQLVMTSGAGDYTVGETVYQGDSIEAATATAVVQSWDDVATTLEVSMVTGAFADGLTVLGATSDAEYVLGTEPDILVSETDQTADNTYLDDTSEDIIDNSERNAITGQ